MSLLASRIAACSRTVACRSQKFWTSTASAVASVAQVPPLSISSSTAAIRRLASSSSSAGSTLKALAAENPYKDVVRYEFKNRKWTLQHVDFYSESLACGLLENGLQPGDVILSWLPAHFSESVRLSFVNWEKKFLTLLHLLFFFGFKFYGST